MKQLFVLSLFLFSVSLYAQTIDYETVGNAWTWNIFSQGTGGSFDIVANPSKTGLNTSDSCAMMVIGADGDRWAGVWCADGASALPGVWSGAGSLGRNGASS